MSDDDSTRTRGGGDRSQGSYNERARGESQAQRLDRNLMELLQELRVAQTGVQILFAFLLTLPFSARFDQVTPFQRDVYVATLLCAAASTALIIAPVSIHRFLFRARKKKLIVTSGNVLAHGGLVFLALAVIGSVLLILDEVIGGTTARVMAAVAGAWFVAFWYVLPLALRASSATDDAPDDEALDDDRAAEPGSR